MPSDEATFAVPAVQATGFSKVEVVRDPDAITVDTLLRGRVTLLQPAHGYRSSLDPVLLAAFVAPPFGRFVDVGCASGALAFLLAATDDHATGVGVEIQARLASLASAGLARNDFANRLQILHADVRVAVGHHPLPRRVFDLVVTNPPYRAVARGVQSPDAERAQAHHELSLTLDQWLDAAAALVTPAGRIAAIYPAARLPELLAGLRRRGLASLRVRMVHPKSDRPASRALVEVRLGGDPRLMNEPPLVLHDGSGGYTSEVQPMLGECARSVSRSSDE